MSRLFFYLFVCLLVSQTHLASPWSASCSKELSSANHISQSPLPPGFLLGLANGRDWMENASGDISNNFLSGSSSCRQSALLSWIVLPHPQIHAHLEPVNVTLLGYRVFADLINFRWGHTRLGLALNPMTDVFIRRKKFKDTEETETQREDGRMKVKAEIGVMQQQAKECQGLVTTTRS